MTDNHKDLDLIPAIAPGKDEMIARRRHIKAPRQSNFNGVLVFSLVLMAIVLGMGGFALFEVKQRLDQSNTLLEQASKGVRNLEGRLAATGIDVAAEIKMIKAQQATNLSEIDKLWKIAYRENRPLIQTLQANLENMNRSGKNLDSSITQLTRDLTSLSTKFTQLRANLMSDVKTVRKQIQNQSVSVVKQQRMLAAMEEKIKEVEADIQVFNQYRQQVNQRLLELQRQMQSDTGAPGS